MAAVGVFAGDDLTTEVDQVLVLGGDLKVFDCQQDAAGPVDKGRGIRDEFLCYARQLDAQLVKVQPGVCQVADDGTKKANVGGEDTVRDYPPAHQGRQGSEAADAGQEIGRCSG